MCKKSRAVLRPLCEFPTAAVTNCHKQGGLKPHRYVFSYKFWRSEVLHWFHWAIAKVLAGLVPSRDSREESSLASFSFWRRLAFLGLWLHCSALHPCAPVAFTPSVVRPPWLPSPEDSCDDIRAHPDNLGPSPHLEECHHFCIAPFSI